MSQLAVPVNTSESPYNLLWTFSNQACLRRWKVIFCGIQSPDQPHNPMVNSGAIMSASILLYLVKPEMNMAQKYDYVFDFFKVIMENQF